MNFVIFSGAGISAESGLKTFRDNGGLWHNYSIEQVATPEAFQRNPQLVIDFYNFRQQEALNALPNDAHRAIAELEKQHQVTVITQNVDDLHERAGSHNVIHLHGQLDWAQSQCDPSWRKPLHGQPIKLGDYCPYGAQLRPHIVWFGESIINVDPALAALATADVLLVVGTSLSVYPAAELINYVPAGCIKLINALALDIVPSDFQFKSGNATAVVPALLSAF